MSQSCKTCKFARWQHTKTGRIATQRFGTCLYQIEMPMLPDSVTKSFSFQPEPSRCAIWVDDGKACPCYTQKD